FFCCFRYHLDLHSFPTRRSSDLVDVLVIGAGLVGCSAAYFASQTGHEVVITEMRDIAMGASGRNAGFMISGLDTYYHRAVEEYRSEEHTSELQSRENLVCRLLLE